MNQHQSLFDNIRRYVAFTNEEEELLANIIRTKRIKKRQFIIQPGFVCEYRTYIVQGAFRVYFLDQEGKEHTVSIGIEDWFVSNFYSYITQTPAIHFAEALEDSVVLQMKHEDIEPLCGKIHSLSEYFRLSTEIGSLTKLGSNLAG